MRVRRPLSRLSDHIDALHADVVQALDRKDLNLFRRTVEIYGDVLLTFPQEWARYGAVFDSTLAGDLEGLRPSPLDNIMRILFQELQEALRIGAREFVDEALDLAYRVLAESVGLKAHALWKSMLTHLRLAYQLASDSADGESARLARELSVRYQFEIGRYYLGSVIESADAEAEDRKAAVQFLDQWFDELLELLRFVIEIGDANQLVSLNDQWEQVLEYWQPEFESPADYEVERLETQFGSGDPRVVRARQEHAINKELAELKAALETKRLSYRVGLLWWALRHWEGDDDSRRAVFEGLLGAFPDLTSLANATASALALEIQGMPPWSRWELATRMEGRVHALATDLALLGAFLTAVVMRVNEPVSAGLFKPLGHHIEAAQELLENVARDRRVLSSMDAEVIERRVGATRTALQQAAGERAVEAAAALRAAPLSAEKVAAFRSGVQGAWEETRVIGPIFEQFGRFIIEANLSDVDESEGWFGREELMPKHMFTDVREVGGLDMIARQLGESVTLGEVSLFVRRLADAPQATVEDAEVGAAITAAAAEMRAAGLKPGIVMVPVSWQLEQALEVGHFERSEESEQASVFEGDRRRHWFRGMTAGMHVIRSTSVPVDRLILIDLEHWGRLRQWPLDRAHLLVEVVGFNEESARDLVRSQPNLFAEAGDESGRVNAVLERVRTRIRERFRFEVEDEAAVRFVPLPAELRGSS